VNRAERRRAARDALTREKIRNLEELRASRTAFAKLLKDPEAVEKVTKLIQGEQE
jgi:hypothetical protein